jgi:hypothetical protein
MTSFAEAFGSSYGHEYNGSTWDRPFFDNRGLDTCNKFVAWVDLMGAANHFLLSLPKAACFVGKIHDAGLQARLTYTAVSLHPIADGFYAMADRWADIQDFSARVMRSLAHVFEQENENQHKFLVRSGIAFGAVVDSRTMASGSRTFENEPQYLGNVLVGCPLAWAYKAESKAPPFGIYVDQSVTTHSRERVAWVLHRWWQAQHQPWAASFGQRVVDYLTWARNNAIATRYPVKKHQRYVQATNEYFTLSQPPSP